MDKDIVLKYAQYIQDPISCIEENLQVFDRHYGGYVPFKLFEQQKEYFRALLKYPKNIVKKPRQTGASTTTAAFVAYKIIMASREKPETVLIVANKLDTALEIFTKAREFLRYFPLWMWGENVNIKKEEEQYIDGKGSEKRLKFLNGSTLKAQATSSSVGRGSSPTICLLDEAAYLELDDSILASLVASMAGKGTITLLSTPNGTDPIYWKTYQGALDKTNGFHITEFSWYRDERYNIGLKWLKHNLLTKELESEVLETVFTDESYAKMIKDGYKPIAPWYEEMKRSLNNDKMKIAQELDGDFTASGHNVIDSNTISFYEKQICQPPIIETGMNNAEWIFKEPVEGHKYVAGVDTSTGDGKDYSVMKIFDIDEMEMVFEFRAKCQPDELAVVVFKYGNIYKCLTVVDTTGGYSDLLIHLLEEQNFKHLYYEEYEEDVKVHDKGREEEYKKKRKKAGFKIQKYRVPAISHYVSLVENQVLKEYSIRTINEWKTFIWLNGRQDHMRNFFDDQILASVMALWIAESVYNKIEKAKKVNMAVQKHFIGFGVKAEELEEAMAIREGRKPAPKPIYRSERDPTGEHSWVFWGASKKRR